MRTVLVLLVMAAVAAPGSAHAGRTFYGWLYGTEVMPERGAELQSWISERNKSRGADELHETSWLLSGHIGVTDQLELGFPLEFLWASSETTGVTRTVFDNYGVEARYRFVSQDPVDAPELVPLVRVAVKRVITDRDAVRPELDLVVSYETGIVHILADIGFVSRISADDAHFELRPGIGVSMLAIADVRFGAELYSEIKLDDSEKTWMVIGPNLSWTHGRFWISAAYGIGVIEKTNAPRVQWGIAF